MTTKNRNSNFKKTRSNAPNASFTTVSKNKLKSQLRSLQRKLSKFQSTMNAQQLVDVERKIEAVQSQLHQSSLTSTTKSKWYYKYKAVRFIERVKTVRRIKQAEKENNCTLVQDALLDLCYVMHFPENEKYISLYPMEPLSKETLDLQTKLKMKIKDKIDQGEIDMDALYQSCVHPIGPKKKTKSKNLNEEAKQRQVLGKRLRGEFVPSSSDIESEDEDGNDNSKQSDTSDTSD